MGIFKNILKDASEKCSICGEEVYEGVYCDYCDDTFICRSCLQKHPGFIKAKTSYKWSCVKCS